VVERALLLAAREGRVEPRHLPDFSGGLEAEVSTGAVPANLAALLDGEPTLEAIEQHYLGHLLDKYDGNRRKVADVLGVSERTAYRMLDRYGLK